MFVLNELGDDYENVQHIVERVQPWGTDHGMLISVEEISAALISLVEAKLVAAYNLTGLTASHTPLTQRILIDEIGTLYFLQTKEGEAKQHVNDCYFDDLGMLLNQYRTSF